MNLFTQTIDSLRSKEIFQTCTESLDTLKNAPEVLTAVIFALIFLLGYLYTGAICLPLGSESSVDIFNHYLTPTLVGIVVMALQVGKKSKNDAFIIFLFCLFSVFVHFNFKTWSPVINPSLYDNEFHAIDVKIGIAGAIDHIRLMLGFEFFEASTLAYHSLFVACFFLSFLICTYHGGVASARQLNYSICITLLLGGVLYWVFPAVGPFRFSPEIGGPYTGMLRINDYIHHTGEIPPGVFVEGLAAMPSLHVAHAMVFFLHAAKHSFKWGLFFALSLVWFAFTAMYLGWHYFIDLIPGLLLGYAVTRASQRIFASAPAH